MLASWVPNKHPIYPTYPYEYSAWNAVYHTWDLLWWDIFFTWTSAHHTVGINSPQPIYTSMSQKASHIGKDDGSVCCCTLFMFALRCSYWLVYVEKVASWFPLDVQYSILNTLCVMVCRLMFKYQMLLHTAMHLIWCSMISNIKCSWTMWCISFDVQYPTLNAHCHIYCNAHKEYAQVYCLSGVHSASVLDWDGFIHQSIIHSFIQSFIHFLYYVHIFCIVYYSYHLYRMVIVHSTQPVKRAMPM